MPPIPRHRSTPPAASCVPTKKTAGCATWARLSALTAAVNADNLDRWLRNLGKIVSVDSSGQPMRMLGVSIDVTGQREQEILLRRLAHYDTLTGLPNRVMLARRLAEGMEQALASDSLLGVAYLDLDGFKPVNDRSGCRNG